MPVAKICATGCLVNSSVARAAKEFGEYRLSPVSCLTNCRGCGNRITPCHSPPFELVDLGDALGQRIIQSLDFAVADSNEPDNLLKCPSNFASTVPTPVVNFN
jgi:hypothetical protein